MAAVVVVACSTKSSTDAGAPPSEAAAPVVARVDAGVDAAAIAVVEDAAAPPPEDPFGRPRVAARAGCGALGAGVAKKDVETSFVDGDDLLAIVNRSPTGSLAPDYAPSDMVDIRNGKPKTAAECEAVQCLRKDAAAALDEVLAAMKKAGFPGKVESAFRSYGAQCGTFGNWARNSDFCKATEQSALPGHSQHQLGTTVDLFTEEWAKHPKGVFRDGFGCTDAGRWIREHATEFGFVMPYPIHPDDRHPKQSCVTRYDIPVGINPRAGYRYEHWHIRYIGKEAAARFKAAFDAGDVGKPYELTLEQWLRAEKGIPKDRGDGELPVCDGCNCGVCSTLAAPGEGTCDKKGGALHLDEHGKPRVVGAEPSITDVQRGKAKSVRVVEVKLDVPAGLFTQPPLTGVTAGAHYTEAATFEKLAPFPATQDRAYPPLADAWEIAIEPVPNTTGTPWPYRAALTTAPDAVLYNRANMLLPAHVGATTIRIPVPSTMSKGKVAVMKGGAPHGQERAVELE
ncbi:MAG: M15 family metallopeptidase [Labilithrix sp.]|nr:M15 family metallopeptidase [Labilithrix sp.]MCW5810638.1 M15 family metallopeptidase [Labilithrix sp.]